EQAKIAVLPEPYVSQIANQFSGKSLVVINLQQEFSGKVHRLAGGKFPLGGLWAVSSKIQNKEKAVQKFMTCFEGASQYAMDHPEETAKVTCEKFREYFHSEFPESAVFEALKSGRLEFNFVRSKDMDLNAFLDEIEYPLVNDDIFYNP
ncbi:MAG: hypothetical protein JXC36_02065, partial [Candidatus Atribacteria bacterium]|nr:hypothetical protein [Candidatus Atribacteria bacterium]